MEDSDEMPDVQGSMAKILSGNTELYKCISSMYVSIIWFSCTCVIKYNVFPPVFDIRWVKLVIYTGPYLESLPFIMVYIMISHSISNRLFCCFSFIIAMVNRIPQLLKFSGRRLRRKPEVGPHRAMYHLF